MKEGTDLRMAWKDDVFSHECCPLLDEVREMDRPINLGRPKVTPALKHKAPLRCMGKETLVEGPIVIQRDFAVAMELMWKGRERVR